MAPLNATTASLDAATRTVPRSRIVDPEAQRRAGYTIHDGKIPALEAPERYVAVVEEARGPIVSRGH